MPDTCGLCSELLPDYTIGTWRCYLLRENEATEFELGEVIISNLGEVVDKFPSYADNAATDVRYYGSYRSGLTIRLGIETVNPRLLNIAYNTMAIPVAGGYQLVFEMLAREGVFRVRMIHDVSCRDAQILLYLHRASFIQPVEMPWAGDAIASAELELRAMYCPDEAEPFGYLQVTGDFTVGAL